MKIMFLAPGSSIHSIRWANAIQSRGNQVYFVSMIDFIDNLNSNIEVIKLSYKPPLGYGLNKMKVESIFKQIKPDLVHVHQASGHGFLASISNISPTLLSIYGWEVYDNPDNIIKKNIVKYSLYNSNYLASTSFAMKKQTKSVYNKLNKDIYVTPFGVDVNKFKRINSEKAKNVINIGIVKKLEEKYGIDCLIKAFDKVIKKNEKEKQNLRLIIVGDGSRKEKYVRLASKLNLSKKIDFVGRVKYKDVPIWLNKFDIFCAPSVFESESFGVAVVEALACELPVVVSDVGGLPEVVDDEITGYVVPKENSDKLANRLYELVVNKEKRTSMGKNGRKKVLKLYDWEKNVDNMLSIYKEIISGDVT